MPGMLGAVFATDPANQAGAAQNALETVDFEQKGKLGVQTAVSHANFSLVE